MGEGRGRGRGMSKEQINRRFAESWTTASEGAIELEKKKIPPRRGIEPRSSA